ncbi:ABC transporter permease [Desulfovibrio sp. PG-178-WT-4]|uniref:ABC transporter permease n=1 Tax=Desulfovibrio porci TaxID=2605782 RepID=A0A6L5XLG3_9BACT|nr:MULTISPECIES: ABC transporter permease [Desulfovibrio]MDY3810038.1 ABC transporter permease [Desulfovibrio porci]MSS27889.1 ABC transporter permease [Desulfovibrio porci]
METSPQVTASARGPLWLVNVGGRWNMEEPWPEEADAALTGLADQRVRELRLEATDLGQWDTSLLVFLVQLVKAARARELSVELDLPEGLKRLLHMAFAVPAQEGAARKKADTSFLYRMGDSVVSLPPKAADFLNFCGEVTLSLWRLFLGRAKMRPQDFVAAMHECGVQALPIISLTSLLFGLILAFVGAVQLTQFGAQIYVAGLVGIGMLRVMGAIMVGVVMSGRVGAAYAALIGTMQVNEEVDALSTLGISPVDFLVLPRVLALTAMVPLLTLYADLMGVLGGYLVGVMMLGLNPMEYFNATTQMVPFKHVIIGLVYGTVFGVIIAVAGCYQGMRCGRSAQAVGQATTTAVVHSIVGIIVATAVITVICNVLGV